MRWHAAQVGFVVTTLVVVVAVIWASAHVLSSVTWSERWARPRRPETDQA